MINAGKFSVLGVNIDAVDYDYAVQRILEAAAERRALGVSALAVHGVMTGSTDPEQRQRLNALDLVVPDGQPVRWALNWLHGVKLEDRVYGPTLTLRVVEAMRDAGMAIYLYGSTAEVLGRLLENLAAYFPGLEIAGCQSSKFRTVTAEEQGEIARQIAASGARLVLVGLGCPRQEVWVYEHLQKLDMPMLAVGAAFDFHAGLLPQAPQFMQKHGLEWAFRLYQEPRRLWRRYVLLNPAYIIKLCAQKLGVGSVPPPNADAKVRFLGYA
jgi:exopolysaccharide biosynthesis WecB/TagA/CpsF family protein